jgi:hypothetical protein
LINCIPNVEILLISKLFGKPIPLSVINNIFLFFF